MFIIVAENFTFPEGELGGIDGSGDGSISVDGDSGDISDYSCLKLTEEDSFFNANSGGNNFYVFVYGFILGTVY